MRKIMGIAMALVSFAFLATACEKEPEIKNPEQNEPQTQTSLNYEISVSNNSEWDGAKKLNFYNLSGDLVATKNLVAGKASVRMEDGTYFVQAADVPTSVSYEIPIVTAQNKQANIVFNDSSDDGKGHDLYDVMVIVTENDSLKENYEVEMCLEPLDGSLGFCLIPKETDKNGAVHFTTYEGRYHIKVNSPETDEPVFDNYCEITPQKRFFISKLGDSNDSSQNSPSEEKPSEGKPSESKPSQETQTGGDSQGSGTHKHSFDWTVTTAATCEEDGEEKGVCSCGETETRKIDKLGHDWIEEGESTPATCTEPGFSAYAHCSRCPKTREAENLDALGHDLQILNTTATCTEDGISSVYCSRCDYKEEEKVTKALGHDFESEKASVFYLKTPTCMETGQNRVYCSRPNCNEDILVTLDKVPHEYTRERFSVKPTCTTGGKRTMYCKFGCGNHLDEEDVPPTGHDWYEDKIIKEATCTQEGLRSRICHTCNAQEDYKTDPCGHIFGEFVVDTPATASKEGKKSRHCIFEGCTKTNEETSIEKLSSSEQSYEIRIRRKIKFDFKVNEGLKLEVLDASNQVIQTVSVESDTFDLKVSSDAKRVRLSGLENGYRADEVELKEGEPIVTICAEASVYTGNRVTIDGKLVGSAPEKELDVGDPMYDFRVWDSKNKGNHDKDKWFSELIQGKKLVLFDFFWLGCGPCKLIGYRFNYVYEKYLQPYKDDILVIMIDVMADETDEDRFEQFRKQEGYSDDYIICQGCFDGIAPMLKKWFNPTNLRTPGHVWLDGEGVIDKIGRLGDSDTRFEQEFTNYIFGFLEHYDAQGKFTIKTDGAKMKEGGEDSAFIAYESMEKPFVFDRKDI